MSKLFRCVVLLTILCMFSATAAADIFYDTYQRGLAAFKAKAYADARAEFLRAYDLRPEPVILFNVAQTYRLERSSGQALVYYKRFLAESQIADDLRKEAQAYVTDLEANQAARDAQAKIDADAGPKERDGTPVKVSAPPMDRPSPPSSPGPPRDAASGSTDAVTRGSDRGSRLPPAVVIPILDHSSASARASDRVVPLVVGTGALALLGGGLGFELWAESRYAAAESEMTSQLRRESLYNSANTNRHVAGALVVSGLAAGGAAVWLYLRNDARKRGAMTDAHMCVMPTATGLALSEQF